MALTEALTAGARVGRYFTVVSLLPSLVFVASVYALVHTGAWSGPVNWHDGAAALGDVELGDAAALSLAAVGLSVVLHPAQFLIVQLLEGYWGTSRLARAAAASRIVYYRRQRSRVFEKRGRYRDVIKRSRLDPDTVDGGRLVPFVVARDAFTMAYERYPRRLSRVMPTRFGNALRAHEDAAGSPYGLEAVTVGPHLALTAEAGRLAYLQDRRTQLDLAVRVFVLAVAAFMLTVALLLEHGWALLAALVPYGIAYIAYRGAIVAAQDYGVALRSLFDLDRFRLYEALHVALPDSTRAELEQNALLMRVLKRRSGASVDYVHPEPEQPDATA